jgi:Ca-activated chloride channel family protein
MNYFERPYLLFSLIPLAIYAYFFYRFKFYRTAQRIELSTQTLIFTPTLLERVSQFIPFLRFIALALLVFAIAGPGYRAEFLPDEKNGIDIMIAIDVSGSMISGADFAPKNRLEGSKDLIREFVKKRTNDRMGVGVFAGAAYLQAPITGDIDSLDEVISDIHDSSVPEQGTAIGDAIILCTHRLKNSKAKSRIMLLITDGVSNTGKIDTETAAEIAKEFKIKIYTIGIGREMGGSETDFGSLKIISDMTGGFFYRATDAGQLEAVFSDIDKLEREKIETKPRIFVEPKYELFLLPMMLLFSLDLFLRVLLLRYYP